MVEQIIYIIEIIIRVRVRFRVYVNNSTILIRKISNIISEVT
jgi:hypothetical protein